MSEISHTLGFIGIGLMGHPLTLRLLKSGNTVHVWNRSPEKLQAVAAAGAITHNSIKSLLHASDIIILCLADSAAVTSVIHAEEGILAHGANNKLLIDLSSIHPQTTRHLAEQLNKACGIGWVDAPVSGGAAGAEQGTLSIMAGGNEADINIARTVLKPLYQQFTHMGKLGSGQMTKICNQMIVSCNVMVIAEMIALAQASGVDASKIPSALTGGFADSKPLQIAGPEMANGQFEPIKWRVKTLLKDLHMATDMATKTKQSLPMSGLAEQLMQLHASQGYADQDPATLIKMYQRE